MRQAGPSPQKVTGGEADKAGRRLAPGRACSFLHSPGVSCKVHVTFRLFLTHQSRWKTGPASKTSVTAEPAA